MSSVKLTAKWQLDAALLSRPVDLTALVTMSRASPEKFLEDNTLHRLVSTLLNEKNDKKSDKVGNALELCNCHEIIAPLSFEIIKMQHTVLFQIKHLNLRELFLLFFISLPSPPPFISTTGYQVGCVEHPGKCSHRLESSSGGGENCSTGCE